MILGTLATVATSTDAGAMTAIASTTVSVATGTVTFSSIPQGYDDLRLVVFDAGGSGGTNGGIAFNNDTATNYSAVVLYADTLSFYALRTTNANSIRLYVEPQVNAHTVDIMNYANTSTNKTTISRMAGDTNGAGSVNVTVGLWRSTAAISRIDVNAASRQFQAGSVLSLYGIRRAS